VRVGPPAGRYVFSFVSVISLLLHRMKCFLESGAETNENVSGSIDPHIATLKVCSEGHAPSLSLLIESFEPHDAIDRRFRCIFNHHCVAGDDSRVVLCRSFAVLPPGDGSSSKSERLGSKNSTSVVQLVFLLEL